MDDIATDSSNCASRSLVDENRACKDIAWSVIAADDLENELRAQSRSSAIGNLNSAEAVRDALA